MSYNIINIDNNTFITNKIIKYDLNINKIWFEY